MLGDLRKFGGKPTYVKADTIAKYCGRPVEALYAINFFNGIPYKMDVLRRKLYHYAMSLKKLRIFGLEPPCRNHPYAKWRPDEIIAELDVNPRTYLKLVQQGYIKEQTADEYGKYVYFKDYDYFIRNYVPSRMLNFLPPMLSMYEAGMLLHMTPATMKRKFYAKTLDLLFTMGFDGKKRFTGMSKEMLISYMRKPYERRVRWSKNFLASKPLPNEMTKNLAGFYLKIPPDTVAGWARRCGVFSHKKNESGTMHVYYKADLDYIYEYIQNYKFYGDGKSYYTIDNIRNKFGKTEFWIKKMIVGRCRVVERTGDMPVDLEELEEMNWDYSRRGENNLYIWFKGWYKEDVDKIISSGEDLDPVEELKEWHENFNADRTRKLEWRRKHDAYVKQRVRKANFGHFKVPTLEDADPFETAIDAAMQERELAREARIAEVSKIYAEKQARRNQLRKALGLDVKETINVPREMILAQSPEAEIVTMVYFRNNASQMFAKTNLFARSTCTFHTHDFKTYFKPKEPEQFSTLINIDRLAKKLLSLEYKTPPAWFVLVPGTSMISDPSFHAKLREVPSEYAAVAPYGYEYLLPNGTWLNCPATYGMFSEFSSNNMYSRRIVGTRSVVGCHEVAVMDGPFIAIRGGYLGLLTKFGELRGLGDGRTLVPYIVSMMMHRIGARMCQIEVDSSRCSDYNMDTTQMEWDKIELMLLKLGNVIK